MKVQRFVGWHLEAVGAPTEQRPFPKDNTPQVFLRQLGVALLDMQLSPQDAQMAARLAPLLQRDSQQGPVSAAMQKGIAASKAILSRTAAGFGERSGGWSTNLAGPLFGSDWLLRAAVARYSIGDRTAGLKKADGTMRDIVIAHARPNDPEAVWLPAPDSPFYLMMRRYGPKEAAQTGLWHPLAIEPVSRR